MVPNRDASYFTDTTPIICVESWKFGIRNFSHLKMTYPCEKFWKIVAEEQADVIIGVDAHSPFDLLDKQSVENAERFLKSIGITIIDGLDIPIK